MSILTNYFTQETKNDVYERYTDTVVLSRYLYSIMDVKVSLLLSILEHDQEKALFWGYELYFSGFQEEAFEYLLDIARWVFQIHFLDCDQDNEMIDWVLYCNYVWSLSLDGEHHQLGNCIATMCNHEHNLAPFIERYFQIKIEKNEHNLDNKYIRLKPEDIDVYKQDYSNIKLYQVLQHARKYPINKGFDKIFKVFVPENENNVYFDNWTYYASYSPIWASRMIEYGAMIDLENKKIVFKNEDLEEEFYNKWNYAPDEQPLTTHEQAMRLKKIPENTLETFCNQYGYKIIDS